MASLISTTVAHVRTYMSRYDSSHDFTHIERVLALSHTLAVAEEPHHHNHRAPLDKTLITLAALLHDISDHKYRRPDDPANAAESFLLSAGAAPALAAAVQDVVDHVSYSAEVAEPGRVRAALARHPELGVVQDADRLDALGAVGVGRCFTYSAVRGAGMEDAIRHFEEKLERLAGLMKTEEGRRMAKEKGRRVRLFREWWVEETLGVGQVEKILGVVESNGKIGGEDAGP